MIVHEPRNANDSIRSPKRCDHESDEGTMNVHWRIGSNVGLARPGHNCLQRKMSRKLPHSSMMSTLKAEGSVKVLSPYTFKHELLKARRKLVDAAEVVVLN